MKLIGGVVVFFAALVLGTFAGSVWPGGDVTELYRTVDPQNAFEEVGEARPAQDGIKVIYAGTGRDESFDLDYLRFYVHNGLPHEVEYIGYNAEYPKMSIHVNGEITNDGYPCMMGMTTYRIYPGRLAEMRVPATVFSERPAIKNEISVGFRFYLKDSEEGYTYHSEPFRLPKEFRDVIVLRDH